MVQCAISLGGNLGDVPARFSHALGLLDASGAVSDVRRSRGYRTAPMGFAAGEAFHNAAAVFETKLAPLDVLDLLQDIEQRCGRVRTVHWGPRTLDLDLLLYAEQFLETPRLTVPHPGLWYRRFVLDPLVELIPDAVHPVFAATIRELHARLLERPLPVGWVVSSRPTDWLSGKVGLEDSTPPTGRWRTKDFDTTAIVFATQNVEIDLPQVIRLPDDPAAASQLVDDVLTAALDEPIPG